MDVERPVALPMQPAARSILLAYVEHWRKGQPLRGCRGGGRCCLARREWHVLVPKPMAWPRKRRGSCSTYFQRCCPWSFGNDVVVDQRIWTLSSWEERELRCQRRGWRCPSAGTRSGEPCRRIVGGGARAGFCGVAPASVARGTGRRTRCPRQRTGGASESARFRRSSNARQMSAVSTDNSCSMLITRANNATRRRVTTSSGPRLPKRSQGPVPGTPHGRLCTALGHGRPRASPKNRGRPPSGPQ